MLPILFLMYSLVVVGQIYVAIDLSLVHAFPNDHAQAQVIQAENVAVAC